MFTRSPLEINSNNKHINSEYLEIQYTIIHEIQYTKYNSIEKNEVSSILLLFSLSFLNIDLEFDEMTNITSRIIFQHARDLLLPIQYSF